MPCHTVTVWLQLQISYSNGMIAIEMSYNKQMPITIKFRCNYKTSTKTSVRTILCNYSVIAIQFKYPTITMQIAVKYNIRATQCNTFVVEMQYN